MSGAFVRESDDQWLNEVAPSVHALVVFLTRENNGIGVYELKNLIDPGNGKEIHVMSNGLSYAKDDEGKWFAIVE